MTEQETRTDLELEEILKEFRPRADDGKVHEHRAPELSEDMPIRPERPDPQEPDVMVWTPKKRRQSRSDDTVSFDPSQVRAAQRPVATPQETTRIPQVPQVEPFSAEWEPQYDVPIPDYTPAQPIRFRPRSRLVELQQKLREGPEKIYDALSEKGTVRLQAAIFLSFLLVVLASGAIVMHQMELVQENRMRLLVFSELFAMLLSALLCWERLCDGLLSLGKGRFTLDTLLCCSFAACIADCICCLEAVQMPFCAAFSLQCMMALWASYHRRTTLLDQTDVLRKANRLNRVVKAPGCFEDKPGFRTCEGQVEDYMDTLDQPAAPQTCLDRYALAALLASAAVGGWAGYRGGVSLGLRTWSAAILAAVPATMHLCQSRPLAILQRRLHKYGAVLCGWAGIQAACGNAVVTIQDRDIFPEGSLKINGVKFFSDRSPNTILGYAEAVLTASGDCEAPLFEQLLRSRHAQRYEVDAFQRYGDRGMGGIVCGEPVLLGTRKFLRDMGIAVDPATKVSHAIYMSIDGEFVGIFALAAGKRRGVGPGLHALCGQRGLTPVIATNNFLVRKSYLKKRFRLDPERVLFPPPGQREKLASWEPTGPDSVPCALVTQEGLGGVALSIAGARSLRTASYAGAMVHMLGGVVGLCAVLALTILGRADLLTPTNLLLLELCWAMPGLLISQWARG